MVEKYTESEADRVVEEEAGAEDLTVDDAEEEKIGNTEKQSLRRKTRKLTQEMNIQK